MISQQSSEQQAVASWPELIDQAREGCDSALAQIVNRFESYLLMIAAERIGVSVKAKFGASDIVQASLMEACEEICDFRGTSEQELRGWLKRIVLNNLSDQLKQFCETQKRALSKEYPLASWVSSIPDPDTPTPSVVIRRQETDDLLKHLVDQLPANQRQVVESRHRFGYSYAQIAVQMGTTEANARQLWSRATQQLRQWLNHSEEN